MSLLVAVAFGKTTLAINKVVDTALHGKPAAWFTPSYRTMTEVWRDVERILKPVTSRLSIQEHRIELITGGVLEFWSLDDVDAGRGRKYARVIIDEAAMVRNLMGAWSASIRPTLTDLKGDAWFLSTPKGRNGFWQLYQLGLDPHEPDWSCWRMPTVTNPYIDPAEVEAARRMLPEAIFNQEYLADFIESSGGVFRRIREAATAEPQTQSRPGSQYLFGVDFGKHEDFTVITVIEIKTKTVVQIDRFNQIDYHVQMQRLTGMYQRFKPVAIIAERNSMGDPLIEQMQRQGLPVWPFTTTNATKSAIIDGLALAFERSDITILDDLMLISELQAYEMDRLPSGLFRYGAPSGFHDDCVMSLALAWYGISQSNHQKPRSREY